MTEVDYSYTCWTWDRVAIGLTPGIMPAAILLQPAGFAAAWSSSDKWATWSNGGYTIRNDVWGSGAGPQSIWANF